MNIVFWPATEADVAETVAWYERQADGLGRALLGELHATLDRIDAGAHRYPKAHGAARRALLRRFPCAVYFYEHDEKIVVLAVFHHRRGPDALRARRGNPPSD